jgi:hypothetical protein
MIYPSSPEARPPISRSVLRLSEHGAATIAHRHGVTRLRNLHAVLEWLTSPSVARPSSHIWLSPASAGWDLLALPLLRAGYEVRLSRRRGEYLGLWVTRAGAAFETEHEGTSTASGRGWFGGSAADLVSIPPGLPAEEETRATWEQLDRFDRLVRERWPGAGLGSSVASTAVSAFKTMLRHPIGLSKAVAAELIELDAYGGGHVERYCARGASFHATAGDAPWETDLSSAYPTAMASLAIPGDFVGYGSANEALDDCRITTCVVNVPERRYPPLRFRDGAQLTYPWGLLLGTFPSSELRSAAAAGCEIRDVLRVYRFEDRSDEFGAFADSLLALRRDASGPERDFAKSLGVQFVGALGSRPKTYRVTTQPEKCSGIRLDRPGLYSERVFEPSDRQILSAATTITGGVAGWLGLLLRQYEALGIAAYYIHTDGTGTLGDPTPALERLFAIGQAVPALRIPQGIRRIPGPTASGAWKIEPLESVTCWAPNRRIMVSQSGERRVAAGGISRTLTEAEIEAQMRTDAPSAWTRNGRREGGLWTSPFHVREIDPMLATALSELDCEKQDAHV